MLLLAAALAALPARAATAEVRIGILAYLGADAADAEWSALRTRLAQALPGAAVTLHFFKHDELSHVAATQAVDFVITNPGHYIELESALGASRLLTLHSDERRPGLSHSEIAGAVVTRRDNTTLRELADLKGQRIAIVGKEAFAGYQLPARELLRAGLDLERDLSGLQVVGLPMDRVLSAIDNGEVQAGFVRACLVESDPTWSARFRVIARQDVGSFPCASSTRVYPNWPIATLRHTPAPLAKAVTVALLEMTDGPGPMSWTVPADYQPVHELFKDLRIGPYAQPPAPSLRGLALRYWPWVAGLTALLVLWILYTVRVEQLVKSRTAALSQALRARDELQAHLQASQVQADHLARLSVLGEMSSTLAHELSQPLAAIGNYADSLVLRAGQPSLDAGAVRQAGLEMAEQSGRAAAVLGRIRSFARKRASHRQRVAPLAVAQEAIALFRGMLVDAPEVALHHHLPEAVRVDADPLQLQQILLNLLKNAYDATRALPPARQALQVVLALAEADAERVQLSVIDQGEPIPAELRERLFESFFTTKPDGLGLGLSICRRIAEAHHGRLDALARPGGGMCFTLSLPRCGQA